MHQPQARSEPEHRRVATTFTDQELDQIDEWGFARRIRNRSEVIRRLVQEGLTGAEATKATTE